MLFNGVIRLLDSGLCRVTAFQPGDRNFNAAPAVERTFQIFFPRPRRHDD